MASEWIPARPIVGVNADGSLITVDSWSGKQRGPTLTDAEREAIERAAETLRYLQADYGQTQTEQDAATLRGLLDRTKTV